MQNQQTAHVVPPYLSQWYHVECKIGEGTVSLGTFKPCLTFTVCPQMSVDVETHVCSTTVWRCVPGTLQNQPLQAAGDQDYQTRQGKRHCEQAAGHKLPSGYKGN